MASNESDLKPKKPYLEKVLDYDKLHKGVANLIVAPCHSGKTTAAKTVMERFARCKERVLYLIDTRAGRDAITLKQKAQLCSMAWIHTYDPAWWDDVPNRTNFAIMTYHQFGCACLDCPTFLQGIDLIICDEMHNLIKYIGIEKSSNELHADDLDYEEKKCCQAALDKLGQLAGQEKNSPMIVIMTATSGALTQRFDIMNVPYQVLNYYGRVYEDKTRSRIYYADFKQVIGRIKGRAIIYVPTIKLMKQYAEMVDLGLGNICCLWSIHSTEQMTDEQLAVRKALLEDELVPDHIDLLFLNAAYETCLNINNTDIKTMVIHCSNTDTQIQVRGRLRHDIDNLYLLDKSHEHISFYFPSVYLDQWLPTWKTRVIAEDLDLKNEKGRTLCWQSICNLLRKDGYIVTQEKKNDQRGWRVHRQA